MEWGPALPEDRRKYSSSSERKNHPSGDTLGDDDVFSGAELVDFKPKTEEGNNRLVHFEDETPRTDHPPVKNQKEEEDEKKEDDKLLNDDNKA